jgi:hypothetical protein
MEAGWLKVSYLGNFGSRSNRASATVIAFLLNLGSQEQSPSCHAGHGARCSWNPIMTGGLLTSGKSLSSDYLNDQNLIHSCNVINVQTPVAKATPVGSSCFQSVGQPANAAVNHGVVNGRVAEDQRWGWSALDGLG